MEKQVEEEVGLDKARMDLFASKIVDEIERRGLGERGVWPDHRLRAWAASGGVVFGGKPYAAKINPASIDLAVSPYIRRPRWYWRNPVTRRLVWSLMPAHRRNMKNKQNVDFFWGESEYTESFTMWPGEFFLMSSIEAVRIPDDACALLRTKSTSGRMGFECCDAGWGDPGFGLRDKNGNDSPDGCNWTFEVFNPAPWPILVTPMDYYIQMIMFDLSSAAEDPYAGRYAVQGVEPVGPREEVA